MSGKAPYKLKSPKEEVSFAISTAIRSVEKWREVLKPLLDEAVDDMKADGLLSATIADGLDDFGKYCQLKGEEIRSERKRLGLPAPKKRGG